MVKADFYDGRITINGHAQMLVCNMISTLCRTLEATIKELCTDKLETENKYGEMTIVYEPLTANAQLLVSGFFIGLKEIENDFPDEIKVSKH